jgi:glutamate-ammonia-ligase adenylyltransferase
MALCRARPLYGSARARAELSQVVLAVLTAPRDAARLRSDVIEMRAKMARHKPPRGLLDAKLSRGGLVDLEFLVHYLQLREGAAAHEAITPYLHDAVRSLAERGLVPGELTAAHDALARLLVAARMLAPDAQEPAPAAQAVLAKACGCADWNALLAGFAAARAQVAAAWQALLGEKLEID